MQPEKLKPETGVKGAAAAAAAAAAGGGNINIGVKLSASTKNLSKMGSKVFTAAGTPVRRADSFRTDSLHGFPGLFAADTGAD